MSVAVCKAQVEFSRSVSHRPSPVVSWTLFRAGCTNWWLAVSRGDIKLFSVACVKSTEHYDGDVLCFFHPSDHLIRQVLCFQVLCIRLEFGCWGSAPSFLCCESSSNVRSWQDQTVSSVPALCRVIVGDRTDKTKQETCHDMSQGILHILFEVYIHMQL